MILNSHKMQKKKTCKCFKVGIFLTVFNPSKPIPTKCQTQKNHDFVMLHKLLHNGNVILLYYMRSEFAAQRNCDSLCNKTVTQRNRDSVILPKPQKKT